MRFECDGEKLEGVYHVQLTFNSDYQWFSQGLPEEKRYVNSMNGEFSDGPLKGVKFSVNLD